LSILLSYLAASTLQYSVVPDRIREENGDTWSPPFRDAADVVIDRILDPATIEPIEGYTNEELKRLNLEQKLLSETHEDFAAMRTKDKTVVDKSKAQKTQAQLEQEFVDRAITKISPVCEGKDPGAWGFSGSKMKNK
jgi:hypothetical protein